MGTRHKRNYITIFLLFLILFVGFSPIFFLFDLSLKSSQNSAEIQPPSSEVELFSQSEEKGQISGAGLPRSSIIHTNISEFQTGRTDTTDIYVQTDNWNITYTNFTFSNIAVTNTWKNLESSYALTDFVNIHNETWAVPLIIPINCSLDTVDITTFPGALSSETENVNVTISVWNSTAGNQPDQIISTTTWLNRSYDFAPFPITPQTDSFNLTDKGSSAPLYTNNTINNKFFISFNCSLASTNDLRLWWYFDDSSGSKESHYWNGSWYVDTGNNLTMQVYLKPSSYSPTPSMVSLKVNSISVLDIGGNSGSWINTSFIIAGGSNVFFDVSSLWPVTYNVKVNCTIQNNTQFNSQFIGIASTDLINWNVTIFLQNLALRVTNFTINVTIPFNWNQTTPRVFRPMNPSIAADVTEYPDGAYSHFIINSGGGSWVLYCKGINYIDAITIEKKIGGNFIVPTTQNTTINLTDTIRINATLISSLSEQNGNLSLYIPPDVLNYSDSQPMTNGLVNFTPFKFESFTNDSGFYPLQVSWGNGEQVGIKNVTLNVVYPSTLTVHSPITEYSILGAPINLTVQYTDAFAFNKFGETGIVDANVTCTFGNSTKNDTFDLNQIGNGYYDIILTTISYGQGNYTCNVTAGLIGRNNISISLRIEILYNTTIVANFAFVELYFGFNITLNANYSRVDTASGITGATVKCYIDGIFYSNCTEVLNGNYTLQINTSGAPFKLYPGVHQIKINATLQRYIPNQIFVMLQVNATPTELLLHQNATQQGGKRFNLSVTYNTTSILGGKYLPNSSIRCLIDGQALNEVSNPSQLDNNRFYVIDFNNGTYNIEFKINIGENRTIVEGNPFNITILVNQTGFIDGNVSGLISIWVWNTSVIITSWDAAVNYGENATINLLYYNTTNILIDAENVTCNFPGNAVHKNAQGNYTITFNTTGQSAGYKLITIDITLPGHEWNQTNLLVHIIGTPTLMSPYPTVPYSIKINQTLENIVITYNETNGQPINYANVEITLSNSTYTFINNTEDFRIYYTYVNGICTIDLHPDGLHYGDYNLTVTIENHTAVHAFEPNSTIIILTIEPLDSYILPVQVGLWWSGNVLIWYENESILLRMNFNATFYDMPLPYNESITWGSIAFNLYKEGESIPYTSGSFNSLLNGTYTLNLTLDMPITPLYSSYYENYIVELNGTATDCQASSINISLRYYAKNRVSIAPTLPNDVIEGEVIIISAILSDSFGTPVSNEHIIFTFTITYKSGLQEILIFDAWTDATGIANIEFQLPYNIESFIVSVQSEPSIRSTASSTETETLKTHSGWYYPIRFLKRWWYLIAITIVATYSSYYYFKKYKPKKVKIEEKRETLNYKYVSAVNLLHILIYDKESRELLYIYSSPGLKLTSYLMNSILQSMSMYADMPVEFQEVYLQDDICLTLQDATITRAAILSKNLPSIEMQKQTMKFIDLFEEAFKEKIPEAIKDINIVNISRVIDYEFASQLIEKCFEKSLTYPHIAQRPRDNEVLTFEENVIHKLAYNLNEKSGPFLLGRLLSKAQMETGADLPRLIELAFKLREKEAIKPITPKEADKLKDEMMREKVKTMRKSESPE